MKFITMGSNSNFVPSENLSWELSLRIKGEILNRTL